MADSQRELGCSVSLFDQLHPEWKVALNHLHDALDLIDSQLDPSTLAPDYDNVMRALTTPIDSIRVVIFGQDPYPTPGYANGLAFSVKPEISKLPASLKNIFTELESDLGGPMSTNGDLTRWANQGVLLQNRILTTQSGATMSHKNLGWQKFTDEVARVLGSRSVIAILWGKNAQELELYFKAELVITSPHPSPLSAYRGFFGSKPFSRVNAILVAQGQSPISW